MTSGQTSRQVSEHDVLGRELELGVIRTFVHGIGRGDPVLLLTGDPGIGKTALLDVAVTVAVGSGTRVLRAGGAEFEADLGWSALHQLLLPLHSELDHLAPEHRDALAVTLGLADGEPAERPTLVAAVAALLALAARERPVLLVVDDLQWVDPPTAALLPAVLAPPGRTPVGLLAAARPGTSSGLPAGAVHRLRPLPGEAAERLVADRFPGMSPSARHDLVDRAEGNPLALLELPGRLGLAAARDRDPLPPLPARLRSHFAAQVADLPPPVRDVLLVLALAGPGDRLQDAAGNVAGGVDVRPAVDAGLLLVADDERVRFRHPLVPAAVVGLSTAGERSDAHRTLAAVLAHDLDRHAWHRAEAASRPDEEVAALLERSAHRSLGRGDAAGAVRRLTRAADLSGKGRHRTRRLFEAAHIGINMTGEIRRVPELLDRARRADPSFAGSLLAATTAAFLMFNAEGTVDAAHRLLAGAVADLGEPLDAHDPVVVDALGLLREICRTGGRAELWEPLHSAVQRLRPAVPTDLHLLTTIGAGPDRATDASVRQLDRLVPGLEDAESWYTSKIATVALYVDRVDACRPSLLQQVERGRRGVDVVRAIVANAVLAADGIATGRWDEVAERAAEGVAASRGNGYSLLEMGSLTPLALLAANRGDDDGLDDAADRLTDWATPRAADWAVAVAHRARARAAVGAQQFEDAHRHAAAAAAAGAVSGDCGWLALWTAMDTVEAAVRTGHVAEAAACAAWARSTGAAAHSGRLALLVEGATALAATGDEADEAYERALRVPGTQRWPFDLARVRLAHGEHLRRLRMMRAAREQLDAARTAFAALGAAPWAARAAGELRAATPSGGSAVAGLTAQQHQVARLAAGGLSNKEIAERLRLSHRTVGSHLGSAFLKLGITSRAALRDALRSRAEPTADRPTERAWTG